MMPRQKKHRTENITEMFFEKLSCLRTKKVNRWTSTSIKALKRISNNAGSAAYCSLCLWSDDVISFFLLVVFSLLPNRILPFAHSLPFFGEVLGTRISHIGPWQAGDDKYDITIWHRGFGNEGLFCIPCRPWQIWHDKYDMTDPSFFSEMFWEREYPTSAMTHLTWQVWHDPSFFRRGFENEGLSSGFLLRFVISFHNR